VHRDPQGSAAQNRRIVVALLVSLLLHTPLLLSPGVWRFGTDDETTAPPPELHIELQQGTAANVEPPLQDTPPAVDALVARTSEPSDLPDVPELSDVSEPSDIPERSDTVVDSVEERVADTQKVTEGSDAAPSDSLPPVDSLLSRAAAEEAIDELTPTEPELADAPVPPTDAVLATLAPAQEAVLVRRLVREARELLDGSSLERQLAFEDEHGRFNATLTRQPATDATSVERVTVDVITEHRGERVQTSMQMKRLAFSHFTQLVNRWDDSVALHDDEIAGRFHSNSEILVAYDRKVAPRLLGKVTTAGRIRFIADEKAWRPRPEIFIGGLETRSARIRLPKLSLPVAPKYANSNADMHELQSDTLIIFHGDGNYDCIEIASRAEVRRHLAPDRPTYIVGARDTELRVRGIVNGSVTVYSPERIVVQGDLTYVHGPRTGGDANAYLGLVSDGTIEIDRADVTGPGDLDIHAAVYARKRFVVRNTRARGPATLSIYGSLTAGSLSETEPRYATRVEFDPRFERVRPPGFPETDRYEIETWDGRWRLAEAPELE
jgi:hypothetical protein